MALGPSPTYFRWMGCTSDPFNPPTTCRYCLGTACARCFATAPDKDEHGFDLAQYCTHDGMERHQQPIPAEVAS